jgi:hypothetical protein
MSEGSTCPLFARAEARPHLSTVPLCSIQFSVTNDALCERHLLFPVVVASAIATRRTVEGGRRFSMGCPRSQESDRCRNRANM